MPTLVISQPMLFPWVGMFEQIALADLYVHYDDVPFSKGSFTNRVQLKSAKGPVWMTVPLEGLHLGQSIRELHASSTQPWMNQHLELLARHYVDAPFRDEMLELVEGVYRTPHETLSALLIASTSAVKEYFALAPAQRVYVASRDLAIDGRGSERVLAIATALHVTTYVTGHGARNYLDHVAFEAAGIDVAYMAYERRPYPQQHGAFDPHVSVLDLIANHGRAGRRWVCSTAIPWREFLAR